MKKIYIIVFLISMSYTYAFNKESYTPLTVSISYNRVFYNYETVNMYGVNMEIFISENLSLTYSFAYGQSGRNTYLHTPSGITTGIFLIANSDLEDYNYDDNDEEPFPHLLASGVIMLFIPEGINYYYALSPYISLSAYINPLGFEFINAIGSMSSGIGLKMKYTIADDYIFTPHAGIKYLYNAFEGQLVTDIGFSFGIKL